jgi:ferredoxin
VEVNSLAKFVIEIDKKTCQGFGACVEICPSFFKLAEDDGKSTMLKDSKKIIEDGKLIREIYETDDLECAREGAEACPFKAIHVKDLERDVQLV